MSNNWYQKPLPQIFEELHSGEDGLTQEEVEKRRLECGPNALPGIKRDGVVRIFLRQFQSPLIYVLFGASIIIFALDEITDALIIVFVLLFNAVVGTIQEGKSQKTMESLRAFVETAATVRRDGKEIMIQDKEVVPGDIIILQEGEKIPADARLIGANALRVDEAALTGESTSVTKITQILEGDQRAVTDQQNMVFKGTHVVAGNGKAIVVATGLNTVIGTIAKTVSAIDTEIPLSGDIRYLSRAIIIAVGSISVVLFIIGTLVGNTFREMFAMVVSLAVSVIPEGLPIVLTLVLASGVWRMARRNALIKRLQAVEALGQARIIAVDKTGTITKSEMVIQKVYVGGTFFKVEGIGYEPRGDIFIMNDAKYEKGGLVVPMDSQELILAGKVAAFCANAHAFFVEESKQWRVTGDPTEAALLVFAEKLGFKKDELERTHPLVEEIPFDYKTKYHATNHTIDDHGFLAVVGAPETVLSLSQSVWHQGTAHTLHDAKRTELESIFLAMSDSGLRVLAFAIREVPLARTTPIANLIFVGFYGMRDALRPEVGEAIQRAIESGIRVLMITGDHKKTALAIAKDAGIYQETRDDVLTGEELDTLSETALGEKIERVTVFARVTPEHKLKIIETYRNRGSIIAMTGDGVNDAPSLVAADLGIAMGRIGTEVAKEAADIVLLDDNFGSIISAIEEGRNIYKTIKKVILYLFSTSLGEVLTITGAIVLGMPLPILPAQIIWLNLVTDGFLDVALAMESKEEGLLKKTFTRSGRFLVDGLMAKRMMVMALPMMLGTLFLFNNYLHYDLQKAWTISLTVLAVFQWFNAWNCRSEEKSIFQMNPFSNPFLIAATFTIIILHLLAVYAPIMQSVLRTTPLSLADWLVIIPIACSIILAEEIRKFISRKYTKSTKLAPDHFTKK